MKKQFQLWGTRTLSLVLAVAAANHWGPPLYKQYFTQKKTVVFVPTAKVETGQFTVSFHEIGTLEAVNSTLVISEVGGKIISLVPEGKVVKAGENLVELDTADLMREVRNQQLNYQNALGDVDRVRSEMDILKAANETDRKKTEAQYEFDKNELERAKQELARQQRLADKKLVPGAAVDKASFDVRSKELSLTKSEMDQEMKKTEIAKKESQKKAEIQKVEFAATIAKSNLDEVKGRVNKAVITAPAGGMVVLTTFWAGDSRRKFKEGDNVNPRQTVCQLPDLSSMQVKVKVGEADAPKLRTGLSVLIRLEAIPNKLFHGTIKEISSLATEADVWEGDTPGRKNFEVTISVKEADPKTLKPGMTTDAEFICDSIKNALSVPIESVNERDGKTYVFIKEGKRYIRTQAKVGKHNDNFIIIAKGLKKGQIVALRDPTRPLDQQEAGSSASGADDKKDKKKAAPMPGADKI